MNGIQKGTLIIIGMVVVFFGWVFLRPSDGGSSQQVNYPVQQQVYLTATPTVVGQTSQQMVATAISTPAIIPTAPQQSQFSPAPRGVYIPLDDACYQNELVGVGSVADTLWRLWFPRFVVIVATALVVWLVYLGEGMYTYTVSLNSDLDLEHERHAHALEMAKIQAAHPPERAIQMNVPPVKRKEVKKQIPVAKELVFYFAEMVSEVGLAVRDWERRDGYDRQTINTILEWMDEKAYLITPASPGKSAQWLNRDRIPTPETIVVRLGYSEDEFTRWLDHHLDN